jgi:putative Holliday junction resolvase
MDHAAETPFPHLGLDISERRIGLAMHDSPLAGPQPLFTYARVTRAQDLARVAGWVQRYAAGAVVLGLPLNMDGTPGPRAQWMRRFAGELQRLVSVPVRLQDERLSTVEATALLAERGARDADVDALAAALILERFARETDGDTAATT